jgi:pilus assembly protein CpaC
MSATTKSRLLKAVFGAAMVSFGMSAPAAAVQLGDAVVDTGGAAVTSRQLVLPLGKAAIIDLPRPAADILVSAPEKVETVIRTPRRVYVMGKEPGQANAFFFDRDNQQILNLEIRVEQDADAIAGLIGRLLPDARIDVDSVNGSVVLHGTVDTPVEAQRAEDIAAKFAGPENVVSMLSVREPAQVMLRVRVVEMQRRLIRQLGIDLNGVARIEDAAVDFAVQNSFAISGAALGGLTGTVLTPGFDNIQNLDFAFDVFEQNGLVKTLAEPNITAVSGHPASFLAGGEFPVPEATQNGVPSVTFKEFGVKLDFRPNVLSKGRIQMKMRTEVSELSPTNGFAFGARQEVLDSGEVVDVEGFVVPGITTRNAETTVELPSGGSIAIAGLLQQNITEFVDGVPGIKDTPVLGALFRSQEFQNSQTELVIIATPYIVEATHLSNLTDPASGHVSPTAVQSILLGRLEAAYGVRQSGVHQASLQGPLGFILD